MQWVRRVILNENRVKKRTPPEREASLPRFSMTSSERLPVPNLVEKLKSEKPPWRRTPKRVTRPRGGTSEKEVTQKREKHQGYRG